MPTLPIIPPWPGARVVLPDGTVATCVSKVDVNGGFYACFNCDTDDPTDPSWIRPSDGAHLDLTDLDTLAAFDRRLALRLGAPAEKVKGGVVFAQSSLPAGQWEMWAGGPVVWDRWVRVLEVGDLTDPIEIRLRAWASVEDR